MGVEAVGRESAWNSDRAKQKGNGYAIDLKEHSTSSLATLNLPISPSTAEPSKTIPHKRSVAAGGNNKHQMLLQVAGGGK